MIVSGFTQRNSSKTVSSDTIMPGQHIHCVRCHRVKCSEFVDNVRACVMVTCELCGWRCHGCKLLEHTLSCPEDRVTCLNKEYGCPHVLKRSRMAAHLPVCPASVVFCAEEWSRLPMIDRERGVQIPLPQKKTYLDCGQLDVSLAMRDQRMLIDSLRAPRKLRQTLRNPLTIKYPAAPLPYRRTSFDSDPTLSEDASLTVSEDDADNLWDLSKAHPGLEESIRSRLFRVTKETADSLASALEMTSNILSSSQSRLQGISEAGDGSALEQVNISQTESFHKQCPSNADSSECIDKSCISNGLECLTKSPVNHICKNNTDGSRDEGKLRQTELVENVSPIIDRLARSSVSSDRSSEGSMRMRCTLRDVGGTQLHKLIGYQPEEGDNSEILLHKLLGVSLSIEFINKYVTKPLNMYTFICAQHFRRDEYLWHFKNVHLDIHTGFCGWLEQRCPLAYLGCTFSFQRMEPVQPNTVVFHSWLQESFGLRNINQCAGNVTDDMITTSNPRDTVNCDTVNPLPQLSLQSEINLVSANNIAQVNCQNQSTPISDSTVHEQCDLKGYRNIAEPLQTTSKSEVNAKLDSGCKLNNVNKTTSVNDHHFDKLQGNNSFTEISSDISRSRSQSEDKDIKFNTMRVQPTIYTGCNWDSKVVFEYDMETEVDNELLEVENFNHSLTNLPFEVLRHIARNLDSLSLCNLALTCHLLRDVCCSLLDDCGIVLLDWRKQRSEATGKISWEVTSKRWMFSTSFEPIHSWRFTSNHPTIGDHLKVCPFNKEIVIHDKPVKLF